MLWIKSRVKNCNNFHIEYYQIQSVHLFSQSDWLLFLLSLGDTRYGEKTFQHEIVTKVGIS